MGVHKKEVSTSLNSRNHKLKTRFYRNSLKDVKQAFEKICIEENKSLRQADESEGKMDISTQEYEVFIKVIFHAAIFDDRDAFDAGGVQILEFSFGSPLPVDDIDGFVRCGLAIGSDVMNPDGALRRRTDRRDTI